MTSQPDIPRTEAPRRSLELVIGTIVAVFALGLTALGGLGTFRMIHGGIKYERIPQFAHVIFTLALLAIAVALWVLTVRLLRGLGHRRSASLLGPMALRISAAALLGWALFVVWASIEVGAYSFLLFAIPAVPLAGLAWRRAHGQVSPPPHRVNPAA